MCNYSEYVEEIGFKRGIKQGVKQNKMSVIKKLFLKGMSDQEIMQIVDCNEQLIAKVKASIV